MREAHGGGRTGRAWHPFAPLALPVHVVAGHYGVVRVGKRRSDGQTFAIKTIFKKRPIYVEILRTEVAILESVHHPSVVRLVDKFDAGSHVHLVFETCVGGELYEAVANPDFHFTERQASRIMRKILEAVEYLHRNGIVHRDLKPENVLFKEQGIDSEVRLIDFGLATPLPAEGERLYRHVGTPYYIAPEILARSYRHEADVWSCGVIMYTLLAGFPPFWGDTEREIYQRIRAGRVHFNPQHWEGRSRQARDLIMQMLRVNPVQRISASAALLDPWILYEGDVGMDVRQARTFLRLVMRLRRVAAFPLIKRLAMVLIARSIPEDQLMRERYFFTVIDRDADGRISVRDLHDFVAARTVMLPGDAAWVIEGLCMDPFRETAYLDFDEFTAAIMPRLYSLRPRAIMSAFEALDHDSDGLITVADALELTGHAAFARRLINSAALPDEDEEDGEGVGGEEDEGAGPSGVEGAEGSRPSAVGAGASGTSGRRTPSVRRMFVTGTTEDEYGDDFGRGRGRSSGHAGTRDVMDRVMTAFDMSSAPWSSAPTAAARQSGHPQTLEHDLENIQSTAAQQYRAEKREAHAAWHAPAAEPRPVTLAAFIRAMAAMERDAL